jgi:DNA-binding CsgD family transcriptional regulator/PAS domain-containing protein
MLRFDAVHRAVEGLMEGALIGAPWDELLLDLALAAEAAGATLVRTRPGSRDIVLPTRSIAAPVAEYTAGLHPPDPRSRRVVMTLDEGFKTDFDHFATEEIERDPFYAEFLRPRGLRWHACALIAGTPGDGVFLSLKRSPVRDPYQAEEIAALDHVLPRLRAAALIAPAMVETRAEDQAQIFQRRGEGVFHLDRQGRVLRMNAVAEGMLGHAVRLAGGRLTACFADEQPGVNRIVTAATTLGQPGLVRLTSPDSASRPLLLATPNIGAGRDVFATTAALAVLVDARRHPVMAPPLPRPVRDAFGLTPTESSVAALLAVGLSAGAIADHLGIGRGTVRNHLKSVLHKTETTRQAELVALLSRLQ